MNIFDHYYKKYDAWYDKNRVAYLSELEAIKKVLPKKGKGLEIGVGTGRFAQALGIKFGIDPSIEMLKIAKKRGINVRLGDGEHLPFKNDTFDYVAIIITICFVKDPQKVIEESRRVLKNGGRIIVGIVDKDSFLGKFYQEKKSIFYKQANFFSPVEVSNLLKEFGFEKISFYQTIFHLPEEISRLEATRKGYGKGGFAVIGARKSVSLKYIPKLSHKEIEENHKHFSKRLLIYKKKGLDFVKSRKFILEKAYPLQGSLMELGAGTGYTTLVLAKAGYKFISIDKDKDALKTAALNLAYEKVLSNVKFYVMDGKSMDFGNENFENIVCVNLFHHIDNVNKMLSEIDRVLCINGKVILADFNKKGMGIVDTVHKQEGRVHKNSGVTKDSISSYFHGLGYEIKDYEDKCHWVLVINKLKKNESKKSRAHALQRQGSREGIWK